MQFHKISVSSTHIFINKNFSYLPFHQLLLHQMSSWQSIKLINIMLTIFRTDYVQVDTMSSKQNFQLIKCQIDKMSNWQNVQLTICPIDKMSSQQMSSWKNVKLTKCQVEKMSSWKNASWQNVKLKKWHFICGTLLKIWQKVFYVMIFYTYVKQASLFVIDKIRH